LRYKPSAYPGRSYCRKNIPFLHLQILSLRFTVGHRIHSAREGPHRESATLDDQPLESAAFAQQSRYDPV
jgi:hypothetical protein